MTKTLATLLIASITLSGCGPGSPPTAKQLATKKGKNLADKALSNGDNAEQKNIVKRLELTSQPGLVGYVVLLNDMGKPVHYTMVQGKITSGGKRLTAPDRVHAYGIRDAASDEGTWGSSNPYIYFFDTNGIYFQWTGQYLYSDQPIRLSEEPLVIKVITEQVGPKEPTIDHVP